MHTSKPGTWFVSHAYGDGSALWVGPSEGAANVVLQGPQSVSKNLVPMSARQLLDTAEHIARCVNAHDDLLAALQQIVRIADLDANYEDDSNPYEAVARAAIAKAEGRS